jgi:hypothetical protein
MVKPPRVGDRVIVPFGLEEIEGEVTRVEGKGERSWVTVELFQDDEYDDDFVDRYDPPREPYLTTYRLRDVIRLAVAA